MFLSFLSRVLFPENCLFCRTSLDWSGGMPPARIPETHCPAMIEFLATDHTFRMNRLFERPASVLCPRCWSTLPFAASCGDAFEGEDILSIAPFETGEGLLELVRFLKFRGGKAASVPLGWWMARSLKEFLAGPAGRHLPHPVLVPVPLHRKRSRKRGYNQSVLLAASTGNRLGMEVAADRIVRTRDTRPQTSLAGGERMANVEDAFSLVKGFGPREHTVVLVDDLLTTGATLRACVDAVRKVTRPPMILLTAGKAAGCIDRGPDTPSMRRPSN